MFKFDRSRLQIQQKIGKGRFGTVFPYQKDPQDLKWVVKRIKAEDSDSLIASLPEIVLGFACDHPSVVPVKGYFIEKDLDNIGFNLYMKMPRMKETLGNDLKQRKQRNDPYSEQEIICHFYSVVCGVEHLQNKKIYHGDIKPDNLLLDENGFLRIADIGIAKHVEEEDLYQVLTGQIGTYQYSAPEILGARVTKKALPHADVWSIGAIVLELCLFDVRLLNSVLPRDQLQNKLDELFKSLEGKYSDGLRTLIQRLLSLDPKLRPDIGQVKNELERNFSHLLDLDLLNVKRLDMNSHSEILDQLGKENSEKDEVEIHRLKEEIYQLKLELIEQKSQHEEQIRALVDSRAREEHSKQEIENHLLHRKIGGLENELQQLKDEHQRQLEVIEARSNEKLKTFEEQFRVLEQEKASFEQKSRDLERYLETTVKEQMKAYETQIQALQESKVEGITPFDKEKDNLSKIIYALQRRMAVFDTLNGQNIPRK